jgi:hypothetical protein
MPQVTSNCSMLSFQAVALLVPFLSLSIESAQAQNLLVNGNFDNPPGDISGWAIEEIVSPMVSPGVTWDSAVNCCGTVSSGSAVTDTGLLQGERLIQCVPVSDAGSYDLVANLMFTAIGNVPRASVAVQWFAQPLCATSIGSATTLLAVTDSFSEWRTYGLPALLPPAGTQSALIILQADGGGHAAVGIAHWDGVAFGPATTVPVRLQSFAID